MKSFIFFSYLFITAFCPKDIENPNMRHLWVEKNLYQYIQNGGNPRDFKMAGHLLQLYFYKDKNEILFCYENEGVQKEYEVVSSDSLIIKNKEIDTIAYSILFKRNTEKTLCLYEGKNCTIFEQLDDKYYDIMGIQYFINDIFISGNYYVFADSSRKIVFTSNGNIIGLDGYNKYSLPFFQSEKYNIIILESITNNKLLKSDTFCFEKSGEGIILLNLSSTSSDINRLDRYDDAKILDQFIRLVKPEYQ